MIKKKTLGQILIEGLKEALFYEKVIHTLSADKNKLRVTQIKPSKKIYKRKAKHSKKEY